MTLPLLEGRWLDPDILPDEILLRLHKALQGSEGIVMDGELYKAVDDQCWYRFARVIHAWPISEPNEFDLCFAMYCAKAAGPDDPEHRPARIWEPDLECSCGRRERFGRHVRVGRWYWPSEIIEGIPHYIVCPDVDRGVDDPRHAPHYISVLGVTRCICGMGYVHGAADPPYRTARRLPAY